MSTPYRHSLRTSYFGALLTTAAVLAGCGGDDLEHDDSQPTCEEDTRDDAFVAGISKTGDASYSLSILDGQPAPPIKGDNRWSVEVRDGSGALVAGVTLEAEPFMPDHGHGTAVDPIVTEDGDGIYTIDPVNFFMPGYWETTVTVVDLGATDDESDDTDLDTVVFKFCVDG